jgi:iron(II)-dependent oxidoreductase
MDQDWQSSGYLIAALEDSRRRTLELVNDLSEEQLQMPMLPIINPTVWEVGHVGWFQEKWVLRHQRREPPLLENGDAWWDSAAVAHDTRWDLPLPSIKEIMAYLQRVLERVTEGLMQQSPSEDEAYFCWLACMHEDMHGEALTYTRQTLGYPAPAHLRNATPVVAGPKGDAAFAGGTFCLGARRGQRFVFDNEKWEHPVDLVPFRMSRSLVSCSEFAAFVDDGGYERRDWWCEQGWEWRRRVGAQMPVYWIRDGSKWFVRDFDQVVPLDASKPILHVNWYEADAYCRWVGRRLPTEAEWELAASQLDRLEQMTGAAWQWTTNDFGPYPGFVRDPYKEYSEPWFGSPYKVLRGSCHVTQPRLVRNTWRNFYTKDRRDVFGGFRTCGNN